MDFVFLAGFVSGLKALGINLPSLLAQLINFAILLIVLRLFAYKPLLRVMDERRNRIQQGLADAEAAKQRLSQTEQEIQAELARARQEGQALVAQAQQVATRLQEEARTRAQQEGEQLLERARSEIGMERDAAIAELRREFADITIAAAERVVRRSLDRQAHRQLIEETLSEASLGGGSDNQT
jgi:F-type H+-transporting ATPase subunit b